MDPQRSHSCVDHLRQLDPRLEPYASEFVAALLEGARRLCASDVHLQPTAAGLEVSWRLDGVLQRQGVFPAGVATDVVTRLKVLSGLLTYRTDVPQEGRIAGPGDVEMRVSTFPTLHGERAVVRLFAGHQDLRRLGDLGWSASLESRLRRTLGETSGAVLVTGPAGSGKTTTLYACLREIVAATQGARSLMTLEDPIEAALDGVAQSQVRESAGLTLATGVRSMLRQDPEVLMIGEIRDAETAAAAIGASLTGHLVLTSLHAGSAVSALRRLTDMGVEPYMVRSGVLGVLGQRLARRLCRCARPLDDPDKFLQLAVEQAWEPVGCDNCWGTGYHGRIALTEWLSFHDHPLPLEQLQSAPSAELEQTARQLGMQDRWDSARLAVAAGHTSPAEIRRVLGW